MDTACVVDAASASIDAGGSVDRGPPVAMVCTVQRLFDPRLRLLCVGDGSVGDLSTDPRSQLEADRLQHGNETRVLQKVQCERSGLTRS